MKILFVMPLSGKQHEYLEKNLAGNEFTFRTQENVTREDAVGKDVIVGCAPQSILHDLPGLKLVQLDFAGSDNYARLPIFNGEGAPLLANASGCYGVTISEYMVGAVITLLRSFQIYRDHMKEHKWGRVQLPEIIYGKNTLVLGLGDIGGNFAKRMNAMGSKVYAVRRTDTEKPEYVEEIFHLDKLNEILPKMDIVASCLPNSSATTKIINKETLALMKDGAVFVNVGRGTAVDLDALADALESGKLRGAALDVTDPEPLPENHRLWDMENCFITPHVGGLSQQRDPNERIFALACRNIENLAAGRPIENLVDLSTGYRKL